MWSVDKVYLVHEEDFEFMPIFVQSDKSADVCCSFSLYKQLKGFSQSTFWNSNLQRWRYLKKPFKIAALFIRTQYGMS